MDWKIIPHFPAYEAHPSGDIRNAKRKTLMKKFLTDSGYERLTLRNNGKYVSIDVHRLIAMTFIQNPMNKPTVNHINRVKNDNRVENLEWATYSEQNSHVKKTTYNGDDSGSSVYYPGEKEGEIWKHIPDTNYEISNYGYVFNIERGNFRVLRKDGRGYVSVTIHDKNISIHRMVARMFLPQFTEDCVINHIDGDKSNNFVENLECVTQSQNIAHAYANNLITKTRKRAVVQYDIEDNVVNTFESLTHAEMVTGINRGSIHHAIKRGTCNSGFKWVEIIDGTFECTN